MRPDARAARRAAQRRDAAGTRHRRSARSRSPSRSPLTATIARGAELVTRNSLYRAGYELLYAPLPDDHKRPTKVVLDVGADKLGDILGAQLVGGDRAVRRRPAHRLLLRAAIAGAVAVIVALRLPRSYTKALEESLLAPVGERPAPDEAAEPWVSADRDAERSASPATSSRCAARPQPQQPHATSRPGADRGHAGTVDTRDD